MVRMAHRAVSHLSKAISIKECMLKLAVPSVINRISKQEEQKKKKEYDILGANEGTA